MYNVVNLQICDKLLPSSTAVKSPGMIAKIKAICSPRKKDARVQKLPEYIT